jgi:GH25 family lysozyme M1 (1,4-beta-N-acetylmuramidase)
MVTWIRQFMVEAQIKTGRKPVIYTTTAWWKACTGNSAAFGSYPLRIASYGKSDPALPGGWSKYTFWQHTRKGTVSGITGSTTDEDYLARSRTPVWQPARLTVPVPGSRSARERVPRERGRR